MIRLVLLLCLGLVGCNDVSRFSDRIDAGNEKYRACMRQGLREPERWKHQVAWLKEHCMAERQSVIYGEPT